MYRKNYVRLLICIFAISVIVVGCPKLSVAKNDTITLVNPNEVQSLDQGYTSNASDYFMIENMYDTVIDYHADGSFTPNLAEKWGISDDGLTYTFYLKQGIKFHNGEELKAKDIVFTCERAKKSPFLADIGDTIKSATALDDYTVEIELNYPDAPFLYKMATLFILNEKAVTELGDDYHLNPIGSGPYKFVEYVLGQKVAFERFDDYHRAKAPIKNLVYRIISDENTALLALESGQVDFLWQIPPISYQSVSSNKKLKINKFESRELTHITMNLNEEPFNNLLVRQAINYAVDKDTIVQMALEGLGEPAVYALNSGTFGYSKNVKGYSYDPEKAKDLLAQAGYPNGFEVELKTSEKYKKTAEIVQDQLDNIGIDAKITMSDLNSMMEDISKGDYKISVFMWTVGPDADEWAYVFETGNIVNYAPYSNARVDELFRKGKNSIDRDERIKCYEELFQIVSDDAVMAPLYHSTLVSAFDARLNIPEFTEYAKPIIWLASWTE